MIISHGYKFKYHKNRSKKYFYTEHTQADFYTRLHLVCSNFKRISGPSQPDFPAGNYMFKVNNKNTRTRCEISLKLTINTQERRQWRRSGVFIVYFKHISHLVLVFLLLTLIKKRPAGLLNEIKNEINLDERMSFTLISITHVVLRGWRFLIKNAKNTQNLVHFDHT